MRRRIQFRTQFALPLVLALAAHAWADPPAPECDAAARAEENRALAQAPPLANAFPERLWQGTLDERMARFAALWPSNVARVDDVPFRLNEAGFNQEARRPLYLISTRGLTRPELAALTESYLDAVGRGTLSFPLRSRGNHLYSRVGLAVVAYHVGVTRDVYHATNGYHANDVRIEPLFALSPVEELRLRALVQNALNDWRTTVGPFEMNGATSGATAGKLTDNRPVQGGESHNCTSWICTAPIGENGESLLHLAGAEPAREVHTNPGWWVSWLVAGAPPARVPYVVFWSDQDSLENLVRRVGEAGDLPDFAFYRH